MRLPPGSCMNSTLHAARRCKRLDTPLPTCAPRATTPRLERNPGRRPAHPQQPRTRRPAPRLATARHTSCRRARGWGASHNLTPSIPSLAALPSRLLWRSGIRGPPHIPGAGTPKPKVQGGPSAAPPPPTPHRPTTVCMRTRPRCAGGPQSGMRQLRRPGGPSASAGTGGSPHMPRSRGHGRPQRCPSRHEHSRRGLGRQAHWNCGQRAPCIPWTAVSHRHNMRQPLDADRPAPPRHNHWTRPGIGPSRGAEAPALPGTARSPKPLQAASVRHRSRRTVGSRSPTTAATTRAPKSARGPSVAMQGGLRRMATTLVGYRGGRRPTGVGHLAPRVADSRRHPRRPRAGPAGPPRWHPVRGPGGTLPATRLLKREAGPAPNTGSIPRAQKHRQKKARKKKETEEHGSFDPFKSVNFQRIQVCSRPKAMSAFCFYMWMMSCAWPERITWMRLWCLPSRQSTK